MKNRTMVVLAAVLFLLLLPIGCGDTRQQPEANLDSEANILTVDGVRYLRDKDLVYSGGVNQWNCFMKNQEQIARAKEEDSRHAYLIGADMSEPERLFLYGHYDRYYGPQMIIYDIWFREDLLEELTNPLTVEKVSSETLSPTQLAQLLDLHGSIGQEDSISHDNAEAETQAFDIENFRLWRQFDLPHRKIAALAFRASVYFSARTGTPYLYCLDGRLRPCPQDIIEALGLSPSLPKLHMVAEDDPRLASLLDALYSMYQTEGVSLETLERTCGETQLMQDLQFRVDVYSPEGNSWPLYSLKGYYHPENGSPYLLFNDGLLREIPQEAADSLKLRTDSQ